MQYILRLRLSTYCIGTISLINCLASFLLHTQHEYGRQGQSHKHIGLGSDWPGQPDNCQTQTQLYLCAQGCSVMHVRMRIRVYVCTACSHLVRIEADGSFLSTDQRSKFRKNLLYTQYIMGFLCNTRVHC